MAESSFPTDRPAELVCPWCSASVTPETATCSSCRAILISGEERELPGVTAVDQAIVRGEKKSGGRSRLLSWISGEYVDEGPAASDAHALAPPDPEVQREILRLEIEAEVANLQAEVEAMRAEAAVEGRELKLPEGFGSFANGADSPDAPTVEAGSAKPSAEADDAPPADDNASAPDAQTPTPAGDRTSPA